MNIRSRSSADAETIAIQALAFLGSDTERLERFLSLTGLTTGEIRQAAATPGFLGAVLEHVAGDETLLLTFAANAGIDPASIDAARQKLTTHDHSGQDWHS
jgi:hypothetical protein